MNLICKSLVVRGQRRAVDRLIGRQSPEQRERSRIERGGLCNLI